MHQHHEKPSTRTRGSRVLLLEESQPRFHLFEDPTPVPVVESCLLCLSVGRKRDLSPLVCRLTWSSSAFRSFRTVPAKARNSQASPGLPSAVLALDARDCDFLSFWARVRYELMEVEPTTTFLASTYLPSSVIVKTLSLAYESRSSMVS
jgi:hypothetical protein